MVKVTPLGIMFRYCLCVVSSQGSHYPYGVATVVLVNQDSVEEQVAKGSLKFEDLLRQSTDLTGECDDVGRRG